MSSDLLRQGYESLIEGDPEPLVSLMSDDLIWRGRKNPWRFWQPVPS